MNLPFTKRRCHILLSASTVRQLRQLRQGHRRAGCTQSSISPAMFVPCALPAGLGAADRQPQALGRDHHVGDGDELGAPPLADEAALMRAASCFATRTLSEAIYSSGSVVNWSG
jgi:hypothetical protein